MWVIELVYIEACLKEYFYLAHWQWADFCQHLLASGSEAGIHLVMVFYCGVPL